jgi:signal transduction histidine kinase
MVDWRQVRRWRIDERSLPAGTIERFHEPSAWEKYWLEISVIVAIVILQAGLIAALLLQRVRRRRAEASSSMLAGRLLTAHEDERRRLARDLHDDVTQRLARLAIDAGRMERDTEGRYADGAARGVREELVRLSEDVHALSYRLHPSVLDDLGLAEGLKAECGRLSRQASIPVKIEVADVPPKLPRDPSLCLFRIAQEALRNVVRHAHARAVTVSLSPLGRGLQLTVHDDGRGFDASRREREPSLGQVSMRERVRLVGGWLRIESVPGRGTIVTAWVPLQGAS